MPIPKEDDYGDNQIPYDEAVVEGRNLVSSMKDSQFELGRIADKLEPKYEENTLERFADEIGIDPGTLKSYRTAYKKWKDAPVRPKSFSVAKALNRHPNKADIIQENPDITVKEALEKVKQWDKERSAVEKGKRFPSDYTAHRNTKQIVHALNEFLSDKSALTAMILEIRDHPNTDLVYINQIAVALGNTSQRISTLIENLIPYFKSEAKSEPKPSKKRPRPPKEEAAPI